MQEILADIFETHDMSQMSARFFIYNLKQLQPICVMFGTQLPSKYMA